MYTVLFVSENIKYTNHSSPVDASNVESKMNINNILNVDINCAVCKFRSEIHHHVQEWKASRRKLHMMWNPMRLNLHKNLGRTILKAEHTTWHDWGRKPRVCSFRFVDPYTLTVCRIFDFMTLSELVTQDWQLWVWYDDVLNWQEKSENKQW